MTSPSCPGWQSISSALEAGDAAASAHARACATCLAQLEEHRLLELALLDLRDPPLPADLVAGVMARISATEPLVPSKELVRAGGILAVALLGAELAFLLTGGSVRSLALGAASSAVGAQHFAVGLAATAQSLSTSAPVLTALAGVLLSSLFALYRLDRWRLAP